MAVLGAKGLSKPNVALYFAENYEYLLEFLTELSPPNRSCTILNWNIGGKVLLKYISVCHNMEQIKEVSCRLIFSLAVQKYRELLLSP